MVSPLKPRLVALLLAIVAVDPLSKEEEEGGSNSDGGGGGGAGAGAGAGATVTVIELICGPISRMLLHHRRTLRSESSIRSDPENRMKRLFSAAAPPP
ncbi:hypothetical protein BGZ73_005638 [Actinomortierella ambigua]|nr:hypothetical protein BGZ73_005638 [Actinomortierella ambigua]